MALEPLLDLTVWEQKFLAQYSSFAALLPSLTGEVQRRAARPPGFPDAQVRRGGLLTGRYRAGGQEFLMLLARHNGRWQVLEPAIMQ